MNEELGEYVSKQARKGQRSERAPFIFKDRRWVEEMKTRDKGQVDRKLDNYSGKAGVLDRKGELNARVQKVLHKRL